MSCVQKGFGRLRILHRWWFLVFCFTTFLRQEKIKKHLFAKEYGKSNKNFASKILYEISKTEQSKILQNQIQYYK